MCVCVCVCVCGVSFDLWDYAEAEGSGVVLVSREEHGSCVGSLTFELFQCGVESLRGREREGKERNGVGWLGWLGTGNTLIVREEGRVQGKCDTPHNPNTIMPIYYAVYDWRPRANHSIGATTKKNSQQRGKSLPLSFHQLSSLPPQQLLSQHQDLI